MKKYDWKDVEVLFNNKIIETRDIKHKESFVENFTVSNKKDVLKSIKNLGIELVYGRSHNSPIGYNLSNPEISISDPSELKKIIKNVSKDQWELL